MRYLQHPAVRARIAVLIGIHGTITLGLFALFALGVGAFGIPQSIFEAVSGNRHLGYVGEQTLMALLFLAWGAAGVLGMAGFWAWVLMRRPFSRKKQKVLTILVLCGVVAAAPLTIIGGGGWYPIIAIVGCVTGVVLIADSVLSNYSLERTVRHRGPRLAAARSSWPAAQLGR